MLKDNTYITITRQYGSGGKEVANIVAKKLGINCYDRKIVHLAAERFHNSTEPISNEVMADLITTSYSMPGSLGDYSFESIPFYNKMFKEQSIAILKLAQKGSAVFLGRCSDYILKIIQILFPSLSMLMMILDKIELKIIMEIIH